MDWGGTYAELGGMEQNERDRRVGHAKRRRTATTPVQSRQPIGKVQGVEQIQDRDYTGAADGEISRKGGEHGESDVCHGE